VEILVGKRVTILAFEHLEDQGVGEQIKVVDLLHALTPPDEGKLLDRRIHVFWHLRAEVDVRDCDNLAEGFT